LGGKGDHLEAKEEKAGAGDVLRERIERHSKNFLTRWIGSIGPKGRPERRKGRLGKKKFREKNFFSGHGRKGRVRGGGLKLC